MEDLEMRPPCDNPTVDVSRWWHLSTIYLTKTTSWCHWYALMSSEVSTLSLAVLSRSLVWHQCHWLWHVLLLLSMFVSTHVGDSSQVCHHFYTFTVSSLVLTLLQCHHCQRHWHFCCVITVTSVDTVIDEFNVSPMLSSLLVTHIRVIHVTAKAHVTPLSCNVTHASVFSCRWHVMPLCHLRQTSWVSRHTLCVSYLSHPSFAASPVGRRL